MSRVDRFAPVRLWQPMDYRLHTARVACIVAQRCVEALRHGGRHTTARRDPIERAPGGQQSADWDIPPTKASKGNEGVTAKEMAGEDIRVGSWMPQASILPPATVDWACTSELGQGSRTGCHAPKYLVTLQSWTCVAATWLLGGRLHTVL